MNDQIHEFIIAGSVGLMGWFFGGLDGFIKVLIAFAVVDQITGVCAAGKLGKISSNAGFEGIKRKVVMFLLVGIAHIIDQHILGNSDAMRTAVCLFYIGNEGISIIENSDVLGVPIPKFLRGKFLAFAKKTLDHDTNSESENQENSSSNQGDSE
ncbi:MAG: phage holin family protein [Synergistaceae bacterium]|nr:phage holin family protein [Synergistaceae bacterium]MBR0203790.1 phage holin family protein [Synergistaceae bacterium]